MERAAIWRRWQPMRTIFGAALFLLSGCVADPSRIEATGSVPLSGRLTVDLCEAAIRERAAQYDPVSIETSLTEPVRETADGGRIANLFVEIKYRREGGIESRSATIVCTVAQDGQVTALKG
jgi:hypothetical protein